MRPARAALPLAVTLTLGLTLGACRAEARTTVTVELFTTACVRQPAECIQLGVPLATVEVLNGSGRVLGSGATDIGGHATLSLSGSGSVRVLITSPLIVGGRKEATTMASPGSDVDVSVWTDLAVGSLVPR